MSSPSMLLFFAVLLAFVKHVAGMRGSPETASMLETDVILWGKKCAQFGAKKKSWWSNTCQCPEELPFPRNCEGRSGRSFNLKKTIKEGSNCRCEEIPSCEKFGAELHDTDPTEIQIYDKEWCKCPEDRRRTTKECHGSGGALQRLPLSVTGRGRGAPQNAGLGLGAALLQCLGGAEL